MLTNDLPFLQMVKTNFIHQYIFTIKSFPIHNTASVKQGVENNVHKNDKLRCKR